MKRMIRNNYMSREQAIAFLSDYDDEVIDFVTDYIDEIENISAVEVTDDGEIVEIDPSREKYNIWKQYYLGGTVEAGYFNSKDEFADLVRAVRTASGRYQ